VRQGGGPAARAFDVAVIGAGIMGASAAFQLSRAGVSVIVLERGQSGCEASSANAGTLSVQNKPLASVPAVLEAMQMWESLHDLLGMDVGFRRKGGVRVCRKGEDLERLLSDQLAQSEAGVPSEILRDEAVALEFPNLGPDVVALSWCPLDGMADPFLATEAFLHAARRAGATIREGTPVTGVTGGDGRPFLLSTPKGTVEALKVVAAAGAWNADIAGLVGLKLPIRTLVQQVLITTPLPPVVPNVVTHVEGRLTLKQQGDTGRVLIGGGWPGEGRRGEGGSRVRLESLAGNLQLACSVVPLLEGASLLRAWTGYEGRTSDRLMLAGPLGPEGFHLLGCQSGGFTISPLAGEIITDHILARTPRPTAEVFNPGRFKEGMRPAPPVRESWG